LGNHPKFPEMVLESLNKSSKRNGPSSGRHDKLEEIRSELIGERQHRRRLFTGTALISAGLIIAQPQILTSISALPALSVGLFIMAAIILLRP